MSFEPIKEVDFSKSFDQNPKLRTPTTAKAPQKKLIPSRIKFFILIIIILAGVEAYLWFANQSPKYPTRVKKINSINQSK